MNSASKVVRSGTEMEPPSIVRLERWLRLPVPPVWRSRVAASILSEDWARRHESRRRWSKAHRVKLVVALVVLDVSILAAILATGIYAWYPALVVTGTLILLRH